MKKRLSFLLAALAFLAVMAFGCQKPDGPNEDDPKEDEQPVDLVRLKGTVQINNNLAFDEKATFTLEIDNPNPVEVEGTIKILIFTDKGAAATTLARVEKFPANRTRSVDVTIDENLLPGIYRAVFYIDGKAFKHFYFALDPMQIASEPDFQSDFEEFWATARHQLDGIEMNAQLTELPSKSTSAQKVYLVEFNSIPDGPTGEPVVVRGYYLEPQDGKKHPVLMHYYGYDDLKPSGKLYCPSGSSSPKYAEFYLSTRGQIINNRTAAHRSDGIERDFENQYGDWFAFNFGDRDAYYYRGAFMDCVQAVRFMATRTTSDMDHLFAEGSSQGGAFTYAAAALSDYTFSAVAPCVAFLGDFPDYFQIVSWPANVAKSNKGSMTDQQMYEFLSYFDTKNLATLISCPVIACSCLQDATCPPHTNLAPFNNLKVNDKEYHFFPLLSHVTPEEWPALWEKFFTAHLK